MDKLKWFIFGGCSFTDMHNSWARVIQRDVLGERNCQNVSKSGAGNKFISTAVINCALLAEQRGFIPDISIMWSHPGRIEFPLTSSETPYFNKLFNNNKAQNNDMNPGLYALKDLQSDHDYHDENWWILNGGNVSDKTNWSKDRAIDDEYVDAFIKYQKYFSTTNNHWHNTLTSMLLVQNMAEVRGWHYRATVFREYLEFYKSMCAPQFILLQESIDWNLFTFTNDTDGGLREYTLSNLNTWDDGYDNHPSYEAHEDFVNNFWLTKHGSDYT